MNRYDDTHDPKHPRNTVLATHARSAALRWFVGSLVAFFLLVGVVLVFWNAANPRPSIRDDRAEVIGGTSGYYSTEGGHDPVRRPGTTRDELKFRGELTPPNGTPRR